MAAVGQEASLVARLGLHEWALHRAATAADGVPDAASFALLAEHPREATLVLAPGLACIGSEHGAVSLVLALYAGKPVPRAAAGRRRASSGARACARACAWRKRAMLAALAGGEPLQTALAGALAVAPDFDITGWLGRCAHQGLVLGARLACPTHLETFP